MFYRGFYRVAAGADSSFAKNVAMLITANQSALVQGKVKGALTLTTVV